MAMDSYPLPSRLVIGTASSLKAALLERLASGPLVLDAGAVEAVDTAGLQVLLAAARTARAQGSVLVLGACSPTLRRALALAGCSERLEPLGEEGGR